VTISREPYGHDQVPEVVAGAGDEPRPERADQLKPHIAFGDRLEAVAEKIRVEPDLEHVASRRNRHRFASLADILVWA